MRIVQSLFVLVAIAATSTLGRAQHEPALTVGAPFSDHMVLQRGKPVVVWGTAVPGRQVTVTLPERDVHVRTTEEGEWIAAILPMKAGGPHRLAVSTVDDSITFVDVLIGDVWVASGQSNMDWRLERTDAGEAAIARAGESPEIRLMKVERDTGDRPRRSLSTPGWRVSSPESARRFSAIGFRFAEIIHEEAGIPIGIIQTAWGGTPAEAWTPLPEIEARPDALAGVLERIDRYGATDEPASTAERPHRRAARLYNAMVHPLSRLGIRGVIWYQGESNAGRGTAEYHHLMNALIIGWRDAWQDSRAAAIEFSKDAPGRGVARSLHDDPVWPFYMVQLPNIADRTGEPWESRWAEVREAQRRTADQIPRTDLAITLDLGDLADIHPTNKRPVAERLARLALADAYSRDIEGVTGPRPSSYAISDEGSLIIRFKHARGLQTSDGSGAVRGVAVQMADGGWRWGASAVRGDSLVITDPPAASIRRVRYAWAEDPIANLRNGAGLPASTFELSIDPKTSPRP